MNCRDYWRNLRKAKLTQVMLIALKKVHVCCGESTYVGEREGASSSELGVV
jgi:hypothetical protein